MMNCPQCGLPLLDEDMDEWYGDEREAPVQPQQLGCLPGRCLSEEA